MRYLGIVGVVGAVVLSSSVAAADVVTDWNAMAVDVGRKLALGPNPASRVVAITQIAVFEAVNSVDREYAPYHAYLTPGGPVSLAAAVAQAAHDALLALAPSRASDLDFQLALSLDDIPDGPEKANGIELGSVSAGSIFVRRLSDGATAVVTYPGSTAVGKWRPTPRVPEFLPATGGAGAGGAGAGGAGAGGAGAGGASAGAGGLIAGAGGASAGAGGTATGPVNPPLAASDPQWGAVTPFGLLTGSQFRPPVPPLLTSAEYATALNEVKDIGSGASGTRTSEQTQIAKFWAQQTHIPFNDVARTVANRVHLTIPEKAHLFALLNIALADARIAVWEGKYQYGYWRPITAIRNADVDGNDATEVDSTWNSLLDTPNHPEYVSGHSATGAAGAAVLAAIFGDATGFALHSDTLTNVTRDFDSFSSAAAENAMSRLYGGIHYRFSNEAGLALGQTVAEYELAHQLLPASGGGGEGGESGSAGGAGVSGAAGEGDAGEPSVSKGGSGGKGGSSSKGGSGGKGGSAGKGGSGGRPSGLAGTGGTGATAGTGGGSVAQGGEGGVSPSGGKSGASGKAGKSGNGGAGGTTTTKDDSGCDCAVPRNQTTSSTPWLLGLTILALRGRRRARVSPRN